MAHEFLPLCDVLFNIISLASYFCDVVFDVVTVYALLEHKQHMWSFISLVFIVFSMLASQLFSLKWYLENSSKRAEQRSSSTTFVIVIVHVLQCGVLWRYFKLFIPVNLQYVKHEVRDLCVLRLVHAFCEAAPMLLIQLYLLWLKDSPKEFIDLSIVSTALSMFSVCWALASFSKNVRHQNVHRLVLTWLGVIFQFLWRLGTMSSRVLALTAYATIYHYWIFLVIVLHWITMFLWLISPKNVFNGEKVSRKKKVIYSALIAIVYIFCYINLEEVNSRHKIVAFYITMFLENALLVSVWLVGVKELHMWYLKLLPVTVLMCFVTGIVFMMLYYRFFHVKWLRYGYSQGNGCSTQSACANCQSGVCLEHSNQARTGGEDARNRDVKGVKNVIQDPVSSVDNVNGHAQHINGGLYIPGVFNCRFNPAMKRKKKKPTTFVPPPAQVVQPIEHFVRTRMSQPFWKRPHQHGASSENESSVGSRVNIQQKLQEKKQQQLAELRVIEEEIKQGKLQRPQQSDGSRSSTLRQPIPRSKKQPWLRPEPPRLPYLVPPPRKKSYKTPEVLLAPHNLNGGTTIYFDDGSDELTASSYSVYSKGDDRNSRQECRDKMMYKSYRISSDIDSQISLPRSYTLPREFKYYKRPKSRKVIKSEHFVASTNSSDGDVDSCDEHEHQMNNVSHSLHQQRIVRLRPYQVCRGHGVDLHETKL